MRMRFWQDSHERIPVPEGGELAGWPYSLPPHPQDRRQVAWILSLEELGAPACR